MPEILEKITIIKSVTFEYGVIELRSDNILTYEPKMRLNHYTLKQVKQVLEISSQLTRGIPRPNYTNNTTIFEKTEDDDELKIFTKDHLHKYYSACAMKVGSPITKYMINIYLYLYKPQIPMKMFSTKEEAINWLKSLK